MDNIEKQERELEAQRRLLAQRNRAGRLQGRVVAASLVCFALFWMVVFGQMVTGNDPVLGDKSTALVSQPSRQDATRSQATRELPETEREVGGEEGDDSDESSAAQAAPEIEVQPRPEPEVEGAPEPELEPLTTGQS